MISSAQISVGNGSIIVVYEYTAGEAPNYSDHNPSPGCAPDACILSVVVGDVTIEDPESVFRDSTLDGWRRQIIDDHAGG